MIMIPAYMENNIVVFTAASEYYAPYLGVLLQSMVNNSSESYNYDIIVLEDQTTEHTKIDLTDILSEKANFSLRFLNVSSLLSHYSFNGPKYVSKLSIARLLIPEIMSSGDKALWIDSDTVLNRDIADLFMTDINNYMLAAARDYINLFWDSPSGWSLDEMRKLLCIEPSDYFNCGVLVLNLKRLRESYSAKMLMETASNKKFKFPDQDTLNHLCNGRVYYLPFEWNVSDIPFVFPDIPQHIYELTSAACKNPFLIHYVGPVKPADNLARPLSKYFWKYARQTIYYETLLDRAIHTYINNSKSVFRKTRKNIVVRFINFAFPKNTKRRGFLKALINTVKYNNKLK